MPITTVDRIKRKIYVASSWRNTKQPLIVDLLRAHHHEVYDFKNPAPGNSGFSWDQIDPEWRRWDTLEFSNLVHNHPVAKAGFKLDHDALDWCDTCVLVLPCGRSAHLEAGYAAGQGKDVVFYLVGGDAFEPELMYELGNGYVHSDGGLIERLNLPTRRGNDHFQEACVAWAVEAFTPLDVSLVDDIDERLDRMAEEMVELLQAGGYYQKRAHAMVDHVYETKQPGEIAQEIAGVGVTVALYAAAMRLSRSHAELAELARVQTPEIQAKVRDKRLTKPTGDELMRRPDPDPAAPPADGLRCPRRDEGMLPMRAAEARDTWRERRGGSKFHTCSYCGSIKPEEFMAHWEGGGTLHGTDKSYKAYVMPGPDKFYFQHLDAAQKHRFISLMNEGKGDWLYVDPFFVARPKLQSSDGSDAF